MIANLFSRDKGKEIERLDALNILDSIKGEVSVLCSDGGFGSNNFEGGKRYLPCVKSTLMAVEDCRASYSVKDKEHRLDLVVNAGVGKDYYVVEWSGEDESGAS